MVGHSNSVFYLKVKILLFDCLELFCIQGQVSFCYDDKKRLWKSVRCCKDGFWLTFVTKWCTNTVEYCYVQILKISPKAQNFATEVKSADIYSIMDLNPMHGFEFHEFHFISRKISFDVDTGSHHLLLFLDTRIAMLKCLGSWKSEFFLGYDSAHRSHLNYSAASKNSAVSFYGHAHV